jgi:hypothetical protein
VADSPPSSVARGGERLLWDCETVGRWVANDHAPASARLESELGEHLTQLLLATLREAEPSTPHEERLWRAARDSAA